MWEIEIVHELLRLGGDDLGDLPVTLAQGRDGKARQEVHVLLPVHIHEDVVLGTFDNGRYLEQGEAHLPVRLHSQPPPSPLLALVPERGLRDAPFHFLWCKLKASPLFF